MTAQEIEILRSDKEHLVAKLADTFMENIFSSKYMMHPRLFAEVAADVADVFLAYLADVNDRAAASLGERLAELGLAGRTVADFAPALRHFLAEHLALSSPERYEELQKPVESYLAALIDGFVNGREGHVLREQEKTRRAMEAVHQANLRELSLKSLALDSAGAVVALTDLATTVLYANGAMADLLGHASPAELEGRRLIDSIDAERFGQAMDTVRRGAQWEGVLTMKSPPSKSATILLALSPVNVDGTGEQATVLVIGIPAGA